jgi:hypothetical protein
MHIASDLKSQAKRLRKFLADHNVDFGHSQCLEAIACIYGFRDWNTASAALEATPQRESRVVSPELYMALEREAALSPEVMTQLQRFQEVATLADGAEPGGELMSEALTIIGNIGRLTAQQPASIAKATIVCYTADMNLGDLRSEVEECLRTAPDRIVIRVDAAASGFQLREARQLANEIQTKGYLTEVDCPL